MHRCSWMDPSGARGVLDWLVVPNSERNSAAGFALKSGVLSTRSRSHSCPNELFPPFRESRRLHSWLVAQPSPIVSYGCPDHAKTIYICTYIHRAIFSQIVLNAYVSRAECFSFRSVDESLCAIIDASVCSFVVSSSDRATVTRTVFLFLSRDLTILRAFRRSDYLYGRG